MVRSAIFTLFIVCRSGVALLHAQSPGPSFQELADSATARNYGLANKHLDIGAIELDQKILKEAYLPHVAIKGQEAFIISSLAIRTSEIRVPQLNIDIKEGNNRFTSTTSLLTANAGAEILLYAGGKISSLKKALSQKLKAQTVILEKDRQEIIANISTAYDQLALLKQARAVLDESKKRLDENKRTADKALGYGLITKYEHQKIEVAQAQLTSKNLECEGKRALVLKQLQLFTNIDMARLSAIDHSLRPLWPGDQAPGIDNRPELPALDASISAHIHKVQAEKTWFIPKVQAATSLGYAGLLAGHLSSSDPVLPNGSKLSVSMPNFNIFPMFSIGLGFKWDLFDGNIGKREVQKADLELQKAKNEKKEAVEKLELNLANAETNYHIANAQIKARDTQQKIARNALLQATSEYRTGLIKSTQLIDAENDFENAALEYVQAIFDQRRAAVELLKATGNLTIQSVQ
jgi:outer membrane protein TolC